MIETDKLFKFCFKKNESNAKIKKWVENLYPETIFTDDLYNTKEEITDYWEKKSIQQLDKNKVLKKINSLDNKNDFANFKPLIEKIKSTISPIQGT